MEYRFAQQVLLYCGGVYMRTLTPGEAERLLALGSVERPRQRRVRCLEVKAAARKSLPGFSLQTRFTYRERLLDGAACLTQHKRFALSLPR